MKRKIFNPENYGMGICPLCGSHGYIENPERQCCPKCGGFGFIKNEAKEYKNISTNNPLNTKFISGSE